MADREFRIGAADIAPEPPDRSIENRLVTRPFRLQGLEYGPGPGIVCGIGTLPHQGGKTCAEVRADLDRGCPHRVEQRPVEQMAGPHAARLISKMPLRPGAI